MGEQVIDKAGTRFGAVFTFPFGTVAVSDHPFDVYEGRVLNWQPVINQLQGGQDNITFTLDNSAGFPEAPQKRFSEYWDFTNPPEGSEVKLRLHDVGEDPVDLWEGFVAEIESESESEIVIHVRSIDSLLDRRIGKVIDLDDWPNAPAESVGKMQPRIIGEVSLFKPVLVDDNQVTKLTASVLEDDLTINVEDASLYPDPSGTSKIKIDEEIIKYTGKTATTFTCSSVADRGVDGTVAQSHVNGTDVHEYAGLVFLVDEKAISSVTNIRKVNSQGVHLPADASEYTIVKTGPTTISFAGTPEVPVTVSGSIFKDVDVEEAGSGDAALNSTNACLGKKVDDGGTATEYNFATLQNGNSPFVVERTSDVRRPGAAPMKRAFLVIEHYNVKNLVGNGCVPTVDVYLDSDYIGVLTEDTNTPADVQEDNTIHQEGKGFQDSHTHTITGANHNHTVKDPVLIKPTAERTNPYYAGNGWKAIDDDFFTLCDIIDGYADWDDVGFSFLEVPDPTAYIDEVKLYVCHGDAGETYTGSTGARLYINGVDRANFTFSSSSTPVTSYSGWTDISSLNIQVSALMNSTSYLKVYVGGTTGQVLRLIEVWIEVRLRATSGNTTVGPNATATPLETSSLTWFDVTAKLTGATEEEKWQDMKNKLIKAYEMNFHATSDFVYFLRAFFCVEFVNWQYEFTKTILCDCTGPQAAGNGALVLSQIVTDVCNVPLARVHAGVWLTAMSAASSGYAIALTKFENGRELIDRVAQQVRISVFSEVGYLYAVYKPLISEMSSVDWGFTDADLITPVVKKRLPYHEVYNSIRVNYNKNYLADGEWRGVYPKENTTSQDRYGHIGDAEIEGDAIPSETLAEELADQLDEYNGWLVDLLEFTVHRKFMDVMRTDLAKLACRFGTWDIIEVLETVLVPKKGKTPTGIKIRAIERRIT